MAPPSASTLASLAGEGTGVRAGFTGRGEGNASLTVGRGGRRGRRRSLASLELTPGDAVFMRQVHGAAVARVGAGDRGRSVPGADALVTTECGVALVVLTADCVPVLLIDPGRGMAAVHAGRQGVRAGVVPAAVRALLAATGSEPSAVQALIGPAIGGCCYEVAPALAADMAAAVPSTPAQTKWGTASLDLRAGVTVQLRAAGVTAVTRRGGCTRCEPERWFSHRAVSAGYAAGRNAAVIVRSGV